MLAVLVIFAVSVIKTNAYNHTQHQATFSGPALFSLEEEQEEGVFVKAVPRSSTWGKVFDFNNEGLTENNYQAYTYDFTVTNNTRDEVSYFTFKLTFGKDVYLSSGWNGAVEIHQLVPGGEMVSTIPDLREFNPEDYALGVREMQAGDVTEIDTLQELAAEDPDYLKTLSVIIRLYTINDIMLFYAIISHIKTMFFFFTNNILLFFTYLVDDYNF